jgi:Bacterial SH3 domain
MGALALWGALLLASCGSAPPPQPSTGIAYAGPAALNLRSDLSAKSQTVATVKHGDRMEVLETRRRFAKVRTASGVEGWTDSNELLSDRQMADLRLLAASAAKLPSQGSAKVYEALNIHAEPYRQSPSFFQVPEGGTVEVVGHRLSPHSPPPVAAKPAVVHRASAAKKGKAKTASGAAPLRPAPPPPAPPANWVELSKPHAPAPSAVSPGVGPSAVPAEDDWDLVRLANGDTGWGLARMLAMNIPEEVAQYAGGGRAG